MLNDKDFVKNDEEFNEERKDNNVKFIKDIFPWKYSC